MRIETVVFCGYVFLRNVLAKVLTCHLPEHKLKPSGVCGYVFLRNVLAQVLIWHLPEHDLKSSGRRLGRAEAAPGAPWGIWGALGALGRPMEVSGGSLGCPWEPWGSLRGPCGRAGRPLRVPWGASGGTLGSLGGRWEGPGEARGRIYAFLAALETIEKPLVFIVF